MSLTKNGEKLLDGPSAARFTRIFIYLASRFHWGNFYGLEDDGKWGQLGWAFSLVLLSKYGDEPRESKFYGLKLSRAFEKNLWDAHQKGEELKITEDHHSAYQTRFFECFASWFGLVNIEYRVDKNISYFDQMMITKSDLFDQLFEVNH